MARRNYKAMGNVKLVRSYWELLNGLYRKGRPYKIRMQGKYHGCTHASSEGTHAYDICMFSGGRRPLEDIHLIEEIAKSRGINIADFVPSEFEKEQGDYFQAGDIVKYRPQGRTATVKKAVSYKGVPTLEVIWHDSNRSGSAHAEKCDILSRAEPSLPKPKQQPKKKPTDDPETIVI